MAPGEMRSLLSKAQDHQDDCGGTSGAQFLFGKRGISPWRWGMNQKQLREFKGEVQQAVAYGRIRGQPDKSKPFFYDPAKFDDPKIGPNSAYASIASHARADHLCPRSPVPLAVYQVNAQGTFACISLVASCCMRVGACSQ